MKRKWFAFTVSGMEWTMYVGDHRSFEDIGDSVEGMTYPRRCVCVVNATFAVNRHRAEEIAWHEMKHAVCAASGATGSVYGSNEGREERGIVAVCGHEYQALKSAMGRTHLFPKPPYLAPVDPDEA